jgi:hypothetical protein
LYHYDKRKFYFVEKMQFFTSSTSVTRIQMSDSGSTTLGIRLPPHPIKLQTLHVANYKSMM